MILIPLCRISIKLQWRIVVNTDHHNNTIIPEKQKRKESCSEQIRNLTAAKMNLNYSTYPADSNLFSLEPSTS